MLNIQVAAGDIYFTHVFGDITRKYKNQACFGVLEGGGTKLTLYKLRRVETKEYTLKYLTYLIDMLKLEEAYIDIGKKDVEFSFKPFKERRKNLLVCTLVRFLLEVIGKNTKYHKKNINKVFFENLFNESPKYKNKFRNFCYSYMLLKDIQELYKYWGEGHTPRPDRVVLRTYKDFKNNNLFEKGENNFFYGK